MKQPRHRHVAEKEIIVGIVVNHGRRVPIIRLVRRRHVRIKRIAPRRSRLRALRRQRIAQRLVFFDDIAVRFRRRPACGRAGEF